MREPEFKNDPPYVRQGEKFVPLGQAAALVPFRPEQVCLLKARYDAALLRVWHWHDEKWQAPPIPAENTFDFWEDGYRLVVTVDQMEKAPATGAPPRLCIHASATRPLSIGQRPHPQTALKLFQLLSGRTDTPWHSYIVKGGAVHMIFTREAAGVAA